VRKIRYRGPIVAAKTVKEFCPINIQSASVLDVGAGTGLVGKEVRFDDAKRFLK